MQINPIYLKDFYKTGHVHQYPQGTNLIFSNLTPRKALMPGMSSSVWFGLQYFIKRYLQGAFVDLFNRYSPCWMEYAGFMHKTLGMPGENSWNKFDHIKALEKLKYLPIAIYALPELTVVPCGVPAMVMFNTHPDFAWVVGMLETLLCSTLWPLCTSATIAREYRMILDQYATMTSDMPEFVDYQAHDFSFRGMFGPEAAAMSGMAHLQYFNGSDTIPALLYNQEYYGKPLHLASVPASEHSVQCVWGEEHEEETFRHLITNVYPTGVVSIVSDSWNLWRVIGEYLPRLRDRIMSRDGSLVIRPDSGDPVDILCGTGCNVGDPHGLLVNKGVIESLWDIFGGTINSKGYKQLDPHIGAIYGDGITLDRCRAICERLKVKGFASTNVVFGIGSFSYQYNTRDSLGWAMKTTYAEINGVGCDVYKDPITDDGTKRSARGLLKVMEKHPSFPDLYLRQQCTWDEFYADDNQLKLVYKDGKHYV